ncbi:hypothetical protein SAMN05720472_0508 [Fibrobacter sp. UWR3]|nr:hypothetical protein SAMN05720472_0508 [Fibrobacter sp. UWR3]
MVLERFVLMFVNNGLIKKCQAIKLEICSVIKIMNHIRGNISE